MLLWVSISWPTSLSFVLRIFVWLNFLSRIVKDNILDPYAIKDASKIVPTVIFSPKYGEDVRSSMDEVFEAIEKFPPASKPPLLMVTNISRIYQLYDLAKLCGAKTIKKYRNRLCKSIYRL